MGYGFSYRGIHSGVHGLKVLNLERHLTPPKDNLFQEIPFLNGVYPMRQNYGARIITATFLIMETDLAAVRQKGYVVADWLRTIKDDQDRPVPQPLILDEDQTKRFMAYPVAQVTAQDQRNVAECHVQFICPVPFAEAVDIKQTGGTGENLGTEPTPPVITITATSDFQNLIISLEDKHLELIGDFETDNVIVFNKAKRLVTVNGLDARINLSYDRRWFNIPPGPFTINTVPTTGLTIQAEFRERWK